MTELPEKSIFDRLQDYYRGERISNMILIGIGSVGIVWTMLLYLWRHGNLSSALFISAFPFGLFYVVTGAYRFFRSLKRYKMGTDEINGLSYILSDEKLHLTGRQERFMQKRKMDLFGVLLGFFAITMSLIFELNHLILGTSVSLTIFSAILLAFDLFGQFRTQEFLHHINKKERNRVVDDRRDRAERLSIPEENKKDGELKK